MAFFLELYSLSQLLSGRDAPPQRAPPFLLLIFSYHALRIFSDIPGVKEMHDTQAAHVDFRAMAHGVEDKGRGTAVG